jgi:hypothetical protein
MAPARIGNGIKDDPHNARAHALKCSDPVIQIVQRRGSCARDDYDRI